MNNLNNKKWEQLSLEEKHHRLYLTQVETLELLLEHGAITKAEHDKSLKGLNIKMVKNEK